MKEDCRYFSARLAEVQTRDEGQWLKNQARQKGGGMLNQIIKKKYLSFV